MEAAPKHRWPWLVLLFFVLACLLAVVWMTVAVKRTEFIRQINLPTPASTNSPGQVNVVEILKAAQSYAKDLRSRGVTTPALAPLSDLVQQGWLSYKDVSAFAGMDAWISLQGASETNLQAVLLEIRHADGSKTVTLRDGSVQEVARP